MPVVIITIIILLSLPSGRKISPFGEGEGEGVCGVCVHVYGSCMHVFLGSNQWVINNFPVYRLTPPVAVYYVDEV